METHPSKPPSLRLRLRPSQWLNLLLLLLLLLLLPPRPRPKAELELLLRLPKCLPLKLLPRQKLLPSQIWRRKGVRMQSAALTEAEQGVGAELKAYLT